MSELSRDQVEALAQVMHDTYERERTPGGWLHIAEALAPTVAAMLAEARAEVVRDVEAIPAPGPFDYLADWAQYRSLVIQALARHMPETCGEALGDMRCQLRRGHDGDHEDYSAVAQERRA